MAITGHIEISNPNESATVPDGKFWLARVRGNGRIQGDNYDLAFNDDQYEPSAQDGIWIPNGAVISVVARQTCVISYIEYNKEDFNFKPIAVPVSNRTSRPNEPPTIETPPVGKIWKLQNAVVSSLYNSNPSLSFYITDHGYNYNIVPWGLIPYNYIYIKNGVTLTYGPLSTGRFLAAVFLEFNENDLDVDIIIPDVTGEFTVPDGKIVYDVTGVAFGPNSQITGGINVVTSINGLN